MSRSYQQAVERRRKISSNNVLIRRLINELKDYKIDKDEYVQPASTIGRHRLCHFLGKQRAFITQSNKKIDKYELLYDQVEYKGRCEEDRLESIRNVPIDEAIQRLEDMMDRACKRCFSCKCKEFKGIDQGFPFGRVWITVCSDCGEPDGGYTL